LPGSIALHTIRDLDGIARKEVLPVCAHVTADIELKGGRIEPDDFVRSRAGAMQPRTDLILLWLRRSIQNSFLAKRRTTWRGAASSPATPWRIQCLVQWAQPSILIFVVADGTNYQQILRPSRRNISDPGTFIAFCLFFFRLMFEQFPRCTPEKTLGTNSAVKVNPTIASIRAYQSSRGICEDHHREFEALRFMSRHKQYAVSLVFDNGRFGGFAGGCFRFEELDEAPEA
jgi:hypothetical protein